MRPTILRVAQRASSRFWDRSKLFRRCDDPFFFFAWNLIGAADPAAAHCPSGKVPDLREMPEVVDAFVQANLRHRDTSAVCHQTDRHAEGMRNAVFATGAAERLLAAIPDDSGSGAGELDLEDPELDTLRWEMEVRMTDLKQALGVEKLHDIRLRWVDQYDILALLEVVPFGDAPDVAVTAAWVVRSGDAPSETLAEPRLYAGPRRVADAQIPGVGLFSASRDCPR